MGLIDKFMFLETERPLTYEERQIYMSVLANRKKMADKLPRGVAKVLLAVCNDKSMREYSRLANRGILSSFESERRLSNNHLRMLMKKKGLDDRLHEVSIYPEEVIAQLQEGLFRYPKAI
ncbi:MAG: hypothetical protein EXR59_06215 [Dehalococcoidia bacterium]|nr:hypothetical protein [Dehalococcoidia bacterium]